MSANWKKFLQYFYFYKNCKPNWIGYVIPKYVISVAWQQRIKYSMHNAVIDTLKFYNVISLNQRAYKNDSSYDCFENI